MHDGGGGGRIISPVEDRKLSHRTSRALQSEYLFPTTRGRLKNPHLARFDHPESGAWITFRENHFTSVESLGDNPLVYGSKLVLGQLGKKRRLPKNRHAIFGGVRHGLALYLANAFE